MKYNTFKKYFSNPRLQKYLNHFSGDENKALRLYRANLRLSQAFYPLLSTLEISLRNALDQHFSIYFSDTDWLKNQALSSGFMHDNRLNLQRLPFYMKTNVQKANSKLGPAVSQGKLISELTFGFWTEFFEKTHYKVLKGQPIQAFSNLPPAIKRSNIYSKLNSIRYFRNRIYHYEPICFKNGSFDFSNAITVYHDINDLILWFDSDLSKWCSFVDFVPYEFSYLKNSSKENSFLYISTLFFLKVRFIYLKILRTVKNDRMK